MSHDDANDVLMIVRHYQPLIPTNTNHVNDCQWVMMMNDESLWTIVMMHHTGSARLVSDVNLPTEVDLAVPPVQVTTASMKWWSHHSTNLRPSFVASHGCPVADYHGEHVEMDGFQLGFADGFPFYRRDLASGSVLETRLAPARSQRLPSRGQGPPDYCVPRWAGAWRISKWWESNFGQLLSIKEQGVDRLLSLCLGSVFVWYHPAIACDHMRYPTMIANNFGKGWAILVGARKRCRQSSPMLAWRVLVDQQLPCGNQLQRLRFQPCGSQDLEQLKKWRSSERTSTRLGMNRPEY